MEHFMMGYKQGILCIIVLAMSGASLGESGTTKEAPIPMFKYELTFGITNQVYTPSLLNNASTDFLLLYSKVRGALYSIYGCVTCHTHKCYRGVSAMTFSNQTGCVLVKATLTFQSNGTNADVIKSLFLKAIEGSGEIDGLKLKPKFSEVTSAPTTTTTTATTRSTISTTRPTTSQIIPSSTRPTTTTTTTHTTNTSPSRPTNLPHTTTTLHPTTTAITTTTRPTTTTTTKITARPTVPITSKHSRPHNAASSFFQQRSITLTLFLHFSLSFFLSFLISCSF